MTHNFSETPRAEIPRSSFDRSHGYKTTFNAGGLIPFYVDEALPGDTFNLKVTAFARLATPIKPIMDNMFMETFFFSVPVRQVWENWERFNGEQKNPGDSTDYLVPQIIFDNFVSAGSLYDYMGLPIDTVPTTHPYGVNALHFRAYNHIYDNWFRNQNLVNSAGVQTDDGPDGSYIVRNRSKRPDYFTSCLPWPQKGDEVTIPLTGTAPVTGIGRIGADVFENVNPGTISETGGVFNSDYEWSQNIGAATEFFFKGADANFPDIYADLTEASGVTINELRQSFQIQKILERDARGGTRYPEILKSHFGVSDPQMLVLQRPEFLGGGSSPININPVEQTTQTSEDPENLSFPPSPQGNLAAYGTVTLRNHGFTKSFTEHCLLIGLVNVRADLTYQQGLNRMWSRQSRFDYYWPALSGIGEQAVLNKEIYTQGNVEDDAVFGYQERYAEYRYKPSQITGLFRSTQQAPLDVWHLAQEFDELPILGKDFIEENPPIDRVIAVQDEPHFLFDSYIQLRCARPMPLYGVPGLIDHF